MLSKPKMLELVVGNGFGIGMALHALSARNAKMINRFISLLFCINNYLLKILIRIVLLKIRWLFIDNAEID
jgi:hypothetical protein